METPDLRGETVSGPLALSQDEGQRRETLVRALRGRAEPLDVVQVARAVDGLPSLGLAELPDGIEVLEAEAEVVDVATADGVPKTVQRSRSRTKSPRRMGEVWSECAVVASMLAWPRMPARGQWDSVFRSARTNSGPKSPGSPWSAAKRSLAKV